VNVQSVDMDKIVFNVQHQEYGILNPAHVFVHLQEQFGMKKHLSVIVLYQKLLGILKNPIANVLQVDLDKIVFNV
jgi:hypothetical protein